MLDDFLALGVLHKGQLRRAVLHLVEGLHDHEHDPRHNKEVDDGADERAEIDTVLGAGDGDGEARDIGAVAAGDELDERIDDVSDVTMAVNAAPMMMPTAISITLPRLMNSLNSARRLFMVDPFLRETFCQGIMPLFCRVSIAS